MYILQNSLEEMKVTMNEQINPLILGIEQIYQTKRC